jgi:hypothetical protein
MLGSMITSQLSDIGTSNAVARALNIPALDWAAMKVKGYTDDQIKNMAKSNRIAFDVLIDEMVRVTDQTDNNTWSSKLAKTVIRLSGANYTTVHHRTSIAALIENHVGSMTRQYDWKSLPAADKKVLEGKGINEQDWAIYKLATPDVETGLLGFSQINAVGTDAIKGVIPNIVADIHKNAADFIQRMNADERNKWSADYQAQVGNRIEKAALAAKRDAHLKLTAYALEEAELAVLQPSLDSRSIMPLRKGEILSELGGAVLQFKTFAIALYNQHMIQRAQMMDGTLNQYAYRLKLLATTSVLGGMGLLMNDIITFKDPRQIFDPEGDNPYMAPAKFGMQAILKGGGLSIFGDLLNTFFDEGRNATDAIFGPSSGKINKIATIFQEAHKAARGDSSKVAKSALDLSKEFNPLNSLIWTRAVWNNYLMAELNEMAAPGYMERMKVAAEKNYGSDYYLGMGNEPKAPNFGNIYGQ